MQTRLSRMIDEAVNDCVAYGAGRRVDPGMNITVTAEWAVDKLEIEITILERRIVRLAWTETPGKGGTKWA